MAKSCRWNTVNEIICCILLVFLNEALGNKVINYGIKNINLNGKRESFTWTAYGKNGTTEISIPAAVPGGIYSALEDNGVLKSKIYHDYNDVENKWVGRMNWTYTRLIAVRSDHEILSKSKVVLVCDGLDTVSEIFLNGENIGSSKNMFVRYEFDITNKLQNGNNSLQVAFESPVLYAEKEYINHAKRYGYEVYPSELVPEFRGENKAQMIRKMMASFSWDWGPSYPSSGIWKDIYIQAFDAAVIRDVLIFTTANTKVPDETDKTSWELKATVYFDIASQKETGILSLKSNTDPSQSARMKVTFSSSGKNTQSITIVIPGSKVALWWPNGYGKQALHNYTLTYQSDSHNEISSRVVRVGFRTTGLVEDLINPNRTEWGREFYFTVNGAQFYSKGSNSIPLHVLPERVTPEHTRWLLESAQDVHMNMIRVSGAGAYESDLFYDLADELGIFIWQDFMLSCSMYPATPEFLQNVKEEVTTQVKRLQHHPSIILWAGNNENELALSQNWFGTDAKYEVYKSDYLRLYIGTMKPLVESLDPSRKYLTSSPTNGIQSEIEGWVAQQPQDVRFGDIHQYDYYGDSWDWKIFHQGRFASEYGLQSFPYYRTLAEVSSNIYEWTWSSQWLDHRQRHPKGEYELTNLIRAHLPIPNNYNSVEALPVMLYLTQITQVMGQKTETELYRRLMDKFNETSGVGYNMGALYWQLNDIGPYCSWASIEYNGRWKMQHYYAKMFFNPILPSPYLNLNGDVIIELISDSPKQVFKQMRVRIFKTDSMQPLIQQEKSVTATYMSSREVLRISSQQLADVECNSFKRNSETAPCVVFVDLLPGCVSNFLYLQYPVSKQFIVNPNITVTNVKKLWDGKITFELKVNQIAQFVFLNLVNRPDGKFVSMGCEGPDEFDGNLNNGFLMVDASKLMVYQSTNPITVTEFIEHLEVLTLYDATTI